MTEKTKSELRADITATFPDNRTGRITAEGLRTYLNDELDSVALLTDAIGPPGPTGPAGPAGGAPTDAQYIVAAADGTLTAERALTDTATVTWDFSTPGQAKATAAGGSELTDPLFLEQGIYVGSDDATWIGDPGNRRAVDFTYTTDSSTSNPNYSNETTLQVVMYGSHGQNTLSATHSGKKTFHALNMAAVYNAAGQKNLCSGRVTAYGMGDTSIGQDFVDFAGGPVNGDEGQGLKLVSALAQQNFLSLTTINSVPTQSTMNTTITQSITASTSSQTVTVASTTGAVVGDWVIIGQEIPSGGPTLEGVQIEAIGSGTITAKFFYNHVTGSTVTPALVLDLTSTYQLGQDRFLVNLSATPYTTGTAHGAAARGSSGALTGIGTSWTTNMVGGNALNIGAISLAADDVTAGTFAGANLLRSWHQIVAVSSATSLGVFSLSVANDQAYKGRSVGAGMAGAYTIRPCAKVLRITASPIPAMGRVICESSTSTWTAGNNLEQAICCYPDVTGMQYSVSVWTPCGTNRAFMHATNRGATTFDYGIILAGTHGYIGTGGGADTHAWGTGITVGSCHYGMTFSNIDLAAIQFNMATTSQGTPLTNGKILWGGVGGGSETSIRPIETSPGSGVLGFEWQMCNQFASAGQGLLKTHPPTGAQHVHMSWAGSFQVDPRPFSWLPTASSTYKGAIACVTDSTTATWGATIAGGGFNNVLAFCNGTNWTVMAV